MKDPYKKKSQQGDLDWLLANFLVSNRSPILWSKQSCTKEIKNMQHGWCEMLPSCYLFQLRERRD